MTTHSLNIAVCQFPVSGDVDANLKYILRYLKRAAAEGAGVVHFPEAALSGYGRHDFESFVDFHWPTLEAHSETIKAHARRLKMWIVLGSCRQRSNTEKPRNCLHVISPSGDIVGTYDKHKLYGRESSCYSKGSEHLVVPINGIKCGFLICYDSCFPALYETYRDQGVSLLFHSYYNARNSGSATSLDDLILAQLRTRSADHQMTISASNSSARHSRLAACIVSPDGSINTTRRHVPGIATRSIPDTDPGWTYDNRQG